LNRPLSAAASVDATELAVVTEIDRHAAGAAAVRQSDWLAREEPLEIRVRGQSIAVTMRTPGHDSELACGFLVTEGLLHERDEVIEIAHCVTTRTDSRDNILNVFVAPSVQIDFQQLTRHVFASSSCGLCGKASIDAVHQKFPAIRTAPSISGDVLGSLTDKLLAAQDTFAKTGGLHAAALFDLDGSLLVVREDVGRHNAVDKVIGWAFLQNQLPLSKHILLVSGRASFEILQKALAAQLGVIAAVSAPSSLAVEFARDSGQTLIGFLRGSSFNAYTNPASVR
jgi:FdhD protein